MSPVYLKILTLCCFLSLCNLYWAEFKSRPTGGYWALPCQCSENDHSWGIWEHGQGWKGGMCGLACRWRAGPDVGMKVIYGPLNESSMTISFYLIYIRKVCLFVCLLFVIEKVRCSFFIRIISSTLIYRSIDTILPLLKENWSLKVKKLDQSLNHEWMAHSYCHSSINVLPAMHFVFWKGMVNACRTIFLMEEDKYKFTKIVPDC